MTDDAELLHRYAHARDEAAFAGLVRRHVDLVHAVALRKVGGDAHLAEDVVQQVFADLARKAAALCRHPVLTGWLFTSTHFAATQLVRAERRRRIREEKAQAMNELNDSPPAIDWDRLRPLLDDLVRDLGERDRAVVLLRFFEGRPFGEIGARLSLSEEGARSRAARALDRLQQKLARRGITSTSAALGLALANQVNAAAPAGLAASVAASALGGATAGMTAFSFMSTAKSATGNMAILAALILSLGANAWLLLRPAEADLPVAAPSATPPGPVAESSPTLPTTLVQHADLAGLRDRMRAEGAGDATIRAVLEGILRRRYREQLSRDRAARLRRGWWRDPQRTHGTAEDRQRLFDDLRLVHVMVTKPLEALLGVDPLDAAQADARYAFLPEETRQALGRLDRENVGGFTATGDPEVDLKMRADFFDHRRRLEDERKAVLATLPVEQQAEYELRFGELARGVLAQLESIAVSEEEFRAVFPLADGYAKALAAQSKSDAAVATAEKAELDRKLMGELVSTLGFDRALEFIWGNTSGYSIIARAAREANLPPSTAARVLQLAAETASQAAALHADPATTADQKRAALLALQRDVQPQVDALLPPAVQRRLPADSLQWLGQLSEGSYAIIAPILPGRVRTVGGGATLSIAGPVPPGVSAQQLLPRRPEGK